MATKLFHPDVYMPNLRLPNRNVPVSYGRHAQEAAANDRYGNLTNLLPATVNPAACSIVEAEITDGKKIEKLVLRMTVGNGLDIVLVFVPATGFIKTVWFNETTDLHRTLNRSRYATAL